MFALIPIAATAAPLARPTITDLHSIPSEEAKLIHLLLGVSDFVHTPSGRYLKQRSDCSILGMPATRRGKSALLRALAAQSIDRRSLDSFLAKHILQNQLYGELFDEFARFFWFSSLKRHTQAFLHLYRALERMSYSFPIAYAIKSVDYKGTYNSFKGYLLNKEKAAELSFFRSFINEIVADSTLNASLRFDFGANSPSTLNAHYATLGRIFSGNQVVSSVQNVYIDVQYRSVVSGIIELRNRYFHFMSGDPNNLTGANLPDSDEFFSIVNPGFVNWLSYIYFRILEARVA